MSKTDPQSPATQRQLVDLINAAFPLGVAPQVPSRLPGKTWQALADTALSQGLTGMLYAAVDSLKRTDVPEGVRLELQDKVRKTVLAQALMYRDLSMLLEEAARSKRELVVLKGAALAKTLYPEPFRRAFGDVDLMIHKADAPFFRAFLLEHGLHEYHEMTGKFGEQYNGEMGFYRAGASGTRLDLHWELVAPTYYRRRMQMDWFWANTEMVGVSGGALRMLNPTAQLVHLGAHVGLHHQDQPRLIWFYDLAQLITQRGGEIRWQEADAYAQQAGLARPIRYALDGMREWWGAELAPQAEGLFVPARGDLGERTVYALTTTAFPEARTLTDVLATPGLGSKVGFVREQLLPDAAYMRTRYKISNDLLMPLYYGWRMVESTFKFTRSLWTAAMR